MQWPLISDLSNRSYPYPHPHLVTTSRSSPWLWPSGRTLRTRGHCGERCVSPSLFMASYPSTTTQMPLHPGPKKSHAPWMRCVAFSVILGRFGSILRRFDPWDRFWD